mmetsp:Transcript_81222/g.143221  ORF Transcript_81222/g.143221 Transcript_81222/m.143221 type:complete len:198 (-) Transcript_81222:613-1206(-)
MASRSTYGACTALCLTGLTLFLLSPNLLTSVPLFAAPIPCNRSNTEPVTQDCKCSVNATTNECTEGRFCWISDVCIAAAKVKDCPTSDTEALVDECKCVQTEDNIADCSKGHFCYTDHRCNSEIKGFTNLGDGKCQAKVLTFMPKAGLFNCHAGCNARKDCTGYSVTPGAAGHCMLWKGELAGGGAPWQGAQCYKKQ